MKSIYAFILLSFFLFSCNTDDDDPIVACSLEIPVASNLYIELVNTAGENLIENGTYIPADITINNNGGTFTDVVFTEVPGIENFVAVGVFGNDGNNTYEINLSGTETDILLLNLTREEIGDPCPQIVFGLNSAIYNDASKDIQDFGGDFLITVVKE